MNNWIKAILSTFGIICIIVIVFSLMILSMIYIHGLFLFALTLSLGTIFIFILSIKSFKEYYDRQDKEKQKMASHCKCIEE